MPRTTKELTRLRDRSLKVKEDGYGLAMEDEETVVLPAQGTAVAERTADTFEDDDGRASNATEKIVSAVALPLTYSNKDVIDEVIATDLQHRVVTGVRVAATALKLITWLEKSSV